MAKDVARNITPLRIVIAVGAVLVGLCLAAPRAHAEDEPAGLFGNWGGLRDTGEANGLSVEAVLTTDVLGVVDGGVSRGFEAPFNFDLIFTLDTAKAGW